MSDTHVIYFDPHGSRGAGVYCTCGAEKIHSREKVLVAWARRHNERTGHEWKKAG